MVSNNFMLKLQGLTKCFDAKVLWQDVDLTLVNGDLVAITGLSGCGKSTLLNCIGLLEDPNDGNILFNERNVTNLSGRDRVKLYKDKIGFLFQNFGLIEDKYVLDNLLLVLSGMRFNRKKKLSLIIDALSKVGMSDKVKHKVYSLSGGEQQRVALAKLILKSPQIVICDEPSSALDEHNSYIVLDILKRLAKNGSIVIIATHDNLVVDYCDKKYEISNSRLKQL